MKYIVALFLLALVVALLRATGLSVRRNIVLVVGAIIWLAVATVLVFK
jgi:hypothetical protein